MNSKITSLIENNRRLIRYGVMAVVIVLLEMIIFQVTYWLSGYNYQLATVLSFVSGVVLNWIGGRFFIFGKSRHGSVREFIMVLIASLVGLIIQLCVITFSVESLYLYPLVGKGISIIFSFFWNYWFRAAVIYKNKSTRVS